MKRALGFLALFIISSLSDGRRFEGQLRLQPCANAGRNSPILNIGEKPERMFWIMLRGIGRGIAMPDVEAATMLRAVLDELCLGAVQHDTEIRNRVASKLIEAIDRGKPSIDDLREVGRKVLLGPPTMWP